MNIPSASHDPPNAWRAWRALVWLSWRRQARAHLMVWISLGLLALSVAIVATFTQQGRWTMAHWRHPARKGMSMDEHLLHMKLASSLSAGHAVATVGPIEAVLRHGTGFAIFSDFVVFGFFSTFLFPIWSLAFATEGLGREREAGNLLWVLTRPLPRPAIFLAKFVALLPWCLAITLGGFALICIAGGRPGRLALAIYWPAIVVGTLAYASLFHCLAALVKRASIVALLYAFFLETLMGNMPGQFKRFSLSYYVRCIMVESVQDWDMKLAQRPTFIPVSAFTAYFVLIGVSLLFLVVGAFAFSRNEYLDLE